MKAKKNQTISGKLLVADYQGAFMSLATVEVAKMEAERSENSLLNHLDSLSVGHYLSPSSVDPTIQSDVTRASLDAHIKKVQAAQLDTMGVQEVLRISAEDQANYRRRRIRVTVLDQAAMPIESIWFDQQTGWRNSPNTRRYIVGTIEEVVLEKNLLVLKPSLAMRLVNPQLRNYLVYIISPQTLQPMVELTLP